MSAPGEQVVALAVQLRAAADRRPFLLDHVRAVTPAAARRAAFSDAGPERLELLLSGADPDGFRAWLGAVASSGLVRSVAPRRGAAQRSDGHIDDPAQRRRFLDGQYRWSAEALDLLQAHPAGVPDQLVTTELGRVHVDGGAATTSMRWHAAWLRALDGGEWPDPDHAAPEAAALDVTAPAVTARLAHVHWLRLRDGRRDDAAEIAALDALISAAGRSS